MKHLLVHLDGTAEDEIRLAHAEGLLHQFRGARLDALLTNVLPDYVYSAGGLDAGGPVATLVEIEERLERLGTQAHERLKERIRRIGEDHTVRRLDARAGAMAGATASIARWKDLFVATTPYQVPFSAWDAVVEAVLFSSARPLYLVPPACPARSELRTLVFAWQDTTEAARIAQQALPFFKLATRVELLIIGRGNEAPLETQAVDAAAYLAHHGIDVEVTSRSTDDVRVGRAILHEADRLAADAIVMGAFGHSRFREWVLGGVTRDVLELTRLPVIIGH